MCPGSQDTSEPAGFRPPYWTHSSCFLVSPSKMVRYLSIANIILSLSMFITNFSLLKSVKQLHEWNNPRKKEKLGLRGALNSCRQKSWQQSLSLFMSFPRWFSKIHQNAKHRLAASIERDPENHHRALAPHSCLVQVIPRPQAIHGEAVAFSFPLHTVSSVCRLWRDIAHSLPEFWSRLVIFLDENFTPLSKVQSRLNCRGMLHWIFL